MTKHGSIASRFSDYLLFQDSFILLNEDFSNSIIEKATAINKKAKTFSKVHLITPRLLLIAISEVARNPKVTERTIINRYKKELIAEGKRLLTKYESGTKLERDYAAALKQPLDSSLVKAIDEVGLRGDKISSYVSKGEKVQTLHEVLWNVTSMARMRLYKLDKANNSTADLVALVTRLFPEEVEAVRGHKRSYSTKD